MAYKAKLALPDAQDFVTLACFDPIAAPQIFSKITTKQLPNDKLREVFSRAKDYFDEHGSPISNHLDNEFAEELNDRKQRSRAKGYQELLEGLAINYEGINTKYVLSKMNQFIRFQEIGGSMPKIVEMLTDGNLDEVEKTLAMLGSSKREEDFNYMWAGDMVDVYNDIYSPEAVERIPLGIHELDIHNCVPTKKELYILMAAPKRGKSWFGVKCLRSAIEQKKKTLLITLEMSHVKFGTRLAQNLWGRTLQDGVKVSSTLIEKDKFHRLVNIQNEPDYEMKSIFDEFNNAEEAAQATKDYLERKGGDRAFNLAQFPTGTFTMRQLWALYDWLDKVEGWVPDQIILDYPGIMKLDPANKRHEMSRLYQELRAFGVSTNTAMVAFHQTNRSGAESQTVYDVNDETTAGEDFSVTQHADYLITFNQSPQERTLGLARLYAALNRNGKDRYEVVISQNYDCGQFCLDSAFRSAEYADLVMGDSEESEEKPERERAGNNPPAGFMLMSDGSLMEEGTGLIVGNNERT